MTEEKKQIYEGIFKNFYDSGHFRAAEAVARGKNLGSMLGKEELITMKETNFEIAGFDMNYSGIDAENVCVHSLNILDIARTKYWAQFN
jgi:hypothetical protein